MGPLLDAAARKALQAQRFSFLRLLRVGDAMVPVNSVSPDARQATATRLKDQISAEADALFEKHADELPSECERAPSHLQMAALAVASQREILREASTDEYLVVNANKIRSVVAAGLGVFAPPDGERPYAVPAMWIPNRLSMIFSGSLWMPQRKRALVERMLGNFEADLGKAFTLTPADPLPSRLMTRCFYTEFLRKEDEAHLIPVFTAIHKVTFAGVPGFSFVDDDKGGSYLFRFT